MKNTHENRVSILIDGGNFYHLVLKKMGISECDFDFDKFAEFLADGRKVVEMGKRYYIGTVREREGDLKSKEAMSLQTKLFTILKSLNWEIKTSKLREREEILNVDNRVEERDKLRKAGIYQIRYIKNREKGIDVKMVTDLFMGAIDDKYDTAIIVSSDTDLVPAIDCLRNRLGKQIEYIGFSIVDTQNTNNSTKPTYAMIKRTDVQRTLIESELKNFVIPKLI